MSISDYEKFQPLAPNSEPAGMPPFIKNALIIFAGSMLLIIGSIDKQTPLQKYDELQEERWAVLQSNDTRRIREFNRDADAFNKENSEGSSSLYIAPIQVEE